MLPICRRSPLALVALALGGLLAAPGCQSSLSRSLDGKACDAQGRCAKGYVCDTSTGICVHPPPTCDQGQALCGNSCTVLSTDPNNCGGCDPKCTAPANGTAACNDSHCKFLC